MERRKKSSFEYQKYWSLFAGLLIFLAGYGIYQVVKSEPDTGDTSSVTTSTIRTGDIRISAFGSGTLISAVDVKIGFEYGGVVDEVLVVSGDEVEKGEVLAILDDEPLVQNLEKAEADLRELTSDAAVAAAALEIAEAQKAVLTAESELSFLISPYVLKSELRLRDAQKELQNAEQDAVLNPSDEADKRIANAQQAVDHASLSLAMNWETYYEEYVPDFFNFPWRDKFDFVHDYYDPPSEIEVELVWAELAVAEARVEEGEAYLAALVGSEIPNDAFGSKLVRLENAGEMVSDAQEALDETRLVAPIDGVIVELNTQELERVGTKSIVTIAQLEPPTIEVSFDEGDWSLVKDGNPVEVIFDALPEKIYQGEIVFVDPTLRSSQNTTSVSALVELNTSQTGWANLPLYSAVSVEVIAGEVQDAVLLPVEGLQNETGNQGTVLVLENGEYVEKEVDLGLRDVIYVEVTGGLAIGDVVLIRNY